MDVLFSDFAFGISEEEIINKAEKFGFQLKGSENVLEDGSKILIGNNKIRNQLSFEISPNNGMSQKQIYVLEQLEDLNQINEVLERHKNNYFSLVDINWGSDEQYQKMGDQYVLFLQNEEYKGQVSIMEDKDNQGTIVIGYSLEKI